jgi:hypothetical protein
LLTIESVGGGVGASVFILSNPSKDFVIFYLKKFIGKKSIKSGIMSLRNFVLVIVSTWRWEVRDLDERKTKNAQILCKQYTNLVRLSFLALPKCLVGYILCKLCGGVKKDLTAEIVVGSVVSSNWGVCALFSIEPTIS